MLSGTGEAAVCALRSGRVEVTGEVSMGGSKKDTEAEGTGIQLA